jgi:hypothetical protein
MQKNLNRSVHLEQVKVVEKVDSKVVFPNTRQIVKKRTICLIVNNQAPCFTIHVITSFNVGEGSCMNTRVEKAVQNSALSNSALH